MDHTGSSRPHVLTAATSLPPDCTDFHMSHKVSQSVLIPPDSHETSGDSTAGNWD